MDTPTAAASTPVAAKPAKKPVIHNSKIGQVVSDKNSKTIVVEVQELKRHRLYRKTLRRSVRFQAHDEHNEAKLGDLVKIIECRRLSKAKHYRLAEVVQRREAPIDVKAEVREE